MSRSKHRPATCRVCGRHAGEVGRISRTGLCLEHAHARQVENVRGLQTREGPAWQRWLAGQQEWLERTRSG